MAKRLRLIRILAFALGGVVALVAVAAAILLMTFDSTRIKDELTRVVMETKQRTLRIDGELKLSLWPNIGVQLGKTTLSERGSEAVFVALDRARISVAVLPLLSKQLVIDEVELAGANVHLVRHKDGSYNFDDLLSKDKQESQAVRFDVAGVDITNATVAFQDEQAGRRIDLSQVRLSTGRIGTAADGNLSLFGKVLMDKPAVAADLALDAAYRIDLDRKDMTLGRVDMRLKGDVAPLRGALLTLEADRLQARGDTNSVGAYGMHLRLQGGVGKDQVNGDVALADFQLSPQAIALKSFVAQTRVDGPEHHAEVRLDLTGVEGKESSWKAQKLALAVDARQGTSSVKGQLASPLAIDLDGTTATLAGLTGELQLTHPDMPMKSVKLPLQGSASVNWGKQNAALDLDTRFDESHIQAKLGASAFSPLVTHFDVDIDRLNVDKYLPPAQKAPPGKEGAAAADKPIDLSALKGLNTSGTLHVGQLQVSNIKASEVRLQIKAAGGRLDVAPLSANLYEGSLKGSLSVNAQGNQVALKQALTGVRIDTLMHDAINKDPVEGRGNLSVDVKTAGASVAAMKHGLNGSAAVLLRDGAVKGINLAKTFRDIKSKFSGQQDAAQKADAAEKTDFSDLKASFHIANGVAHNKDLLVRSPLLRVTGAGDIDIGASRMDYLAKASVVGTATGQDGRDLAHLKGVTIPVRVSGPFDNIGYNIDTGALLSSSVKAKLKEKVDATKQKAREELKQKSEDQLKGKLKGLLGR